MNLNCCRATLMACVIVFSFSSQAVSATIEIGFLGLDLTYDGLNITDAESSDGGAGDPTLADPIDAVTIEVDGLAAGPVLTDDLFLDVDIPVGLDLPASPGVSTGTSGLGIFDLLIGPTFALALDIDEVSITFVDAITAQFVFGAEVTSGIFDQDLPFGLTIGSPVNLTFSATITPGTLVDDGSAILGFEATGGSGSFSGLAVPEPGALVLSICCIAGVLTNRKCS